MEQTYTVNVSQKQARAILAYVKLCGDNSEDIAAMIVNLAVVGAGRKMALKRLAIRKSKERKVRKTGKGEAPHFKPYAPANAPEKLRAKVKEACGEAPAEKPTPKPPRVIKHKADPVAQPAPEPSPAEQSNPNTPPDEWAGAKKEE